MSGQSDEEERRQRVMVITEFDAGDPEATLHALAAVSYTHLTLPTKA